MRESKHYMLPPKHLVGSSVKARICCDKLSTPNVQGSTTVPVLRSRASDVSATLFVASGDPPSTGAHPSLNHLTLLPATDSYSVNNEGRLSKPRGTCIHTLET